MDRIIIENKTEIQQELQRLGFDNVDELFKNAQPLVTTQSSQVSGLYLTDSPSKFGKPSSGFGFNYRRENNSNVYLLRSTNYTVNVDSDRTPGGSISVSRYWNASDGQVPHKEYMQWMVAKAAKIEKAKELFLSNPSQAILESASRTANSLTFNVELEKSLKVLGFEYDPQLGQSATYKDDLIFLGIREKTEYPWIHEKYMANFFFAVVSPEYKIPLRVGYINASLSRNDSENKAISKEESYWLNREDLPTKKDILRDFQHSLSSGKSRIQHAAEINTLIAEKTTDKGFHL